MRTEVEGLDIDALEKLAEKLTDHHHLMQRDGFAALHATATQAAAALRAQAERVRVLEGENERFTNEGLEEIGAIGRKPTIGKYQAINRTHLRSVIDALDEKGLRAEADTIVWLCWYRVIDANREEFLVSDWRERIAAAEARAEAAERRAGELEGLLEEASNAMRMTALAMESPLGRPTKKHVQHWTSLFHAESQRIRAALLPATQAEGEK